MSYLHSQHETTFYLNLNSSYPDKTESYNEEICSYEHIEGLDHPPTAVKPPTPKPKAPVWPPVKQIEDITFPTASPLYIDPNPALDRRPRHQVRERRADIEAASRDNSRPNSYCENYEEHSTYDLQMEKMSCPGPVYRRVELFGPKDQSRKSRCDRSTSRASSSERRSLTPTRITQPIPRPWTATVTTGTNLYQQAYTPEADKICRQYCEREVCKREKVCLREKACEAKSESTHCHAEKRAYCEQTCSSDGTVHQHKHTAQVSYVCEPKPCPMQPKPCTLPPKPCQVKPRPCPREHSQNEIDASTEVPDLSKIVPPDVAVCPKGIDAEHDLYSETTEKDIGELHIKKTTTYEKTVELVSPDEEIGPSITQEEEEETTETVETVETTREERYERFQRSSTVDREVADISGRSMSESAEMVSSKVDTLQLMEEARKREEEQRKQREEEERRVRQEAERKRQEEEQRLAELRKRDEEEKREKAEADRRRKEEERRRLDEEANERKSVCFSEQTKVSQEQRTCPRERIIDVELETCEKCCKRKVPERPPSREHIIDVEVEGRPSSREHIIKIELEGEEKCECQKSDQYREVVQEFKTCKQNQQSCNQQEEQRRRSLREQVEIHQSLREQQVPERRQTLQERRLCSRLSKKNQEQESVETSCKKHVQFVQECDNSTRSLPPSQIKNTTAKEWKSEMVKALTTAPETSYSSFTPSSYDESSSTSAQEIYSHEVVYEESSTCPFQPVPLPADPPARPLSPFLDALTTAPERPYTPLGRDVDPGSQRPCKRCRSHTPTMETTGDGYCAPAQLLYAEARPEPPKKPEGPRPLPTPPPDFRLRDSTASPCSHRPQTPSGRSMTAGLKKPDTIPSYQKFLVSMEKDPVDGNKFDPERIPTPRAKSPNQPSCYMKAPRVREDPPPCKHTNHEDPPPPCTYPICKDPPPCIHPNQDCSCTPDKTQIVRYHCEEDTPQGHKSKDFKGTKSVHYVEEGGTKHAHIQEHNDTITEECDGLHHLRKTQHFKKEYDQEICEPGYPTSDPEPVTVTCYIKQNSKIKPTLPCPTMDKCNKFPRTGVRVLPPPGPEVRRIRHELPPPPTCPKTGVTVVPCKAYSDSGSKTGVVVVPCDGIGDGGICITPTPDRSGLNVSPCPKEYGGICKKPSCYCGSDSGNCTTDFSNCSPDDICVEPKGDGTFCIKPCVRGVAPVQCPKPIPKPPPKNLPFPQIPLPGEAPPCKECPQSKPCELGFQPIQKPQRLTNLSNQLTQLTLCKRDKPAPPVQLYKPQPQAQSQCTSSRQSQYKCQTTQNQSQFHREIQTSCKTEIRCPTSKTQNSVDPPNCSSQPDLGAGSRGKCGSVAGSSAPKRGKGILNQACAPGSRVPLCGHCSAYVRGPFITALGQIWCPDHFICVNSQCCRQLQDIGFVEEKGQLYCEYCFEKYIAPACNKCNSKIKGDCLNAIGKHFHPECFNCSHCGKLFGNNTFFLEEGLPYCENDWNDLFTTKCFACGFPVEAGDRWVEALSNNYHSQCFNCTMCKKNLEGQSFFAKGGRPFCKDHGR